MLELDFAFRIHALSLCEEFLVCASVTECQAIQLNFSPSISRESASGKKEPSQLVESSTASETAAARSTCPTNCQDASANRDAGSSLIRNGTVTDPDVSSVNCADVGSSDSASGHGRSSALSHRAKLQQDFVHTDLCLSPTSSGCNELFAGPVRGSQAPCPVTVEFEGIIFVFWKYTSWFYMYLFRHMAAQTYLFKETFKEHTRQ